MISSRNRGLDWQVIASAVLVMAFALCLPPMLDVAVTEEIHRASEVGMEIVGQVGGAVRAVAVREQYAYIGLGPRLAVLDISDSSRPVFLGQTTLFSDIVQAVVAPLSSIYVYVAAGSAGLYIIDTSTPTEPVQIVQCFT